jgi:hypothetical protein
MIAAAKRAGFGYLPISVRVSAAVQIRIATAKAEEIKRLLINECEKKRLTVGTKVLINKR